MSYDAYYNCITYLACQTAQWYSNIPVDQQPVHTKGHCPLQSNHQLLPTAEQHERSTQRKTKMDIIVF